MPVKNNPKVLKRGLALIEKFIDDDPYKAKLMRPFRDRKYAVGSDGHVAVIVHKQHINPIEWEGMAVEMKMVPVIRQYMDMDVDYVLFTREHLNHIAAYKWEKNPDEHIDPALFIGAAKVSPKYFAKKLKHVFVELDKTFGRNKYKLEIGVCYISELSQCVLVRTKDKDIDVQFLLMAIRSDTGRLPKDMYFSFNNNQIEDPIIFEDEKPTE